jgi:SNF2 family DNA or RNA helicase
VFSVDERRGRHYELQARLRGNFMVRREKHGALGVATQLQMPVYDIVQMEETGPVKQALAAESLLHLDPDDLSGADSEILGHVAAVRRMMGIALAPQVADYARMLIDGGEEKLVLFAWHVEVLNILEQKLGNLGVVRIDGSTSTKARGERIEQFQTDPDIRICMGNMLAMGVGTDGLQHVANHCLIAEPDWVPGNNIQAIDRLDRGGQKRQVQADLFVAPNSIAERVLASALRKNRTIHKALDHQVPIFS